MLVWWPLLSPLKIGIYTSLQRHECPLLPQAGEGLGMRVFAKTATLNNIRSDKNKYANSRCLDSRPHPSPLPPAGEGTLFSERT